MRKFWYLVWSQADDEAWGQNNIYTESCVVREGLKGKGDQGMETCLKQLYAYIYYGGLAYEPENNKGT
jgi:hypothetical protein